MVSSTKVKIPKINRFHFALQQISTAHVNLLEDPSNQNVDWRVCSPNIVLQYDNNPDGAALEVFDGAVYQCVEKGSKPICHIDISLSSPIGTFNLIKKDFIANYSHDVLVPTEFIKYFTNLEKEALEAGRKELNLPEFYKLPQTTRRSLCDMNGRKFDNIKKFTDKNIMSILERPDPKLFNVIFAQQRARSLYRIRPRIETLTPDMQSLIAEKPIARAELFGILCLPVNVKHEGHSNCNLQKDLLFISVDKSRYIKNARYGKDIPIPFILHEDPSCSSESIFSPIRAYNDLIFLTTDENRQIFNKLPSADIITEDQKKSCEFRITDSEYDRGVAVPFSKLSLDVPRVYVDFKNMQFVLIMPKIIDIQDTDVEVNSRKPTGKLDNLDNFLEDGEYRI